MIVKYIYAQLQNLNSSHKNHLLVLISFQICISFLCKKTLIEIVFFCEELKSVIQAWNNIKLVNDDIFIFR